MKSAHSTRNRYSSQWTLTKCQASTPARTLTSDWRTVGSQHGITVTESDSYSASLSQDTGMEGQGLSGTAAGRDLLLWGTETPNCECAVTAELTSGVVEPRLGGPEQPGLCPALWTDKIVKTQNGLGWKGPYCSSRSTLPLDQVPP